MNVFSQATSLTVDCQNPGWLSSKIGYGDQQTVKDLTVTGYLNGTDIKFLRELNLNRNLNGCINLEDANIVSGGESYGGSDNYVGASTMTQDNTLTAYMFAYLNPIRKVILPKSITSYDGNYLFLNTKVDTLIINGSMQSILIGDGHNNIFWKTRCIYFPEGLSNINLGYLFHSYADLSNIELFFPSTLEKIISKNSCVQDETIIHCASVNPEIIMDNDQTGQYSYNANTFKSGTIYVPKGTKEKYEQSIFGKLIIIEEIPVEGVSIDENMSFYVDDGTKLQAVVMPTDALNQDVEWKSSNPEILEVAEDGTIHAKTYGTAVVTVTTKDGGYTATCNVSIYEHTTDIKIIDSISIPIDNTHALNAQTLPLATSDNKITYRSSNNEIAVVDEQGVVTARKKGNCTITATSVDGGYTATCEVTVTQPVEALTLEKHSLNMKIGDEEKLFVQITPATADNKKISWFSSDEQVATVDGNGNITAQKAGETWIKAISQDNAEVKDSCKVIIKQPVTGVMIDIPTLTFENVGESATINAIVTPDNASNKEVKWTSTNLGVCIVSNGNVVAVGDGTSVVIATTVDGGLIATCTVTVDTTTGIAEMAKDKDSFTIYNIHGQKINQFCKGINILRFLDGKIKKVVIK